MSADRTVQHVVSATTTARSVLRMAPVSVDDELYRFGLEGLRHSRGYSEDYQQLWASLHDTARAGKRFRSSLLLASFDAHGGGDAHAAARVAAAMELLHAAFVIHDDVIDKDLRRRGALNVSGTFVERARLRDVDADGCTTMGVAAGVLAGDLALVGAAQEIALCGADPTTTRRLLDLLTDVVRTSAAGELDDVALGVGMGVGMGVTAGDDASFDQVVTTEEHKTAVYSFQLPLQAGAVLAGSSQRTIELLGTVGRLAGICFQLVDDLRGVFSEESETGKDALGDLREGKLTPLVAHARGTSAWPEISLYVGDPGLDAAGAEEARRLLDACGSRAFVEALAESYLDAALREGEDGGLEPLLLDDLANLCRRIMRSAA